MNNQEIIQILNKILKNLESVDFMSHEKHRLTNNQNQIHNAYEAVDNLIKKLKEEEQEKTRDKNNKRRYYFIDKGLPKRKIELFNVEIDNIQKIFSGYDKENNFYKLSFSDTDLVIEEVK